MPTYCTREDVLRELGGDRPTLEQRFDESKWRNEPLEDIEVDGLTFKIPTSILVRIDKRIAQASSKLNTKILEAYRSEPLQPYPEHLVQAAAQLAALNTVNTDGTRPEYLRTMAEEVESYFRDIADMRLDLGIEGERPDHRTAALVVVSGVGGGAGGGRGRRGLGARGCGCGYRGCGC